MPRNVYNVSTLVGVSRYAAKVSSMAVANGGDTMFFGTNDGNLMRFQCRQDTAFSAGSGSFECFLSDTQKLSKDKKPIRELYVIDSLHVMLCLVGIKGEGSMLVCDLRQNGDPSPIHECKGVRCFGVEESENLLYVCTKRKIYVFSWEGVSFVLQQELPLSHTPQCCAVLPADAAGSGGAGDGGGSGGGGAGPGGGGGVLALGFKRGYALFDALGGRRLTPVAEAERDQPRPLALALPRSPSRGPRALVAKEAWGVLVDPASGAQRETLQWSAPPLALRRAGPFILALLPDKVEVHDAGSLAPLQAVDAAGALALAGARLTRHAARGGETTFVATEQDIHVLKMVPIETQVEGLVRGGAYEEALGLCALCEDPRLLGDIDVRTIHERYARELLGWGDPEAALAHFRRARCAPARALARFPALLPDDPSLLEAAGGGGSDSKAQQARPLTGAGLHRAAAALCRYLEEIRPEVKAAADRAELRAASGGGGGGGRGGAAGDDDEEEEEEDAGLGEGGAER